MKLDIIKKELKTLLKERYNLDSERIEKNEQSTDGNVYIVYCNDKQYIIKIYSDIEHTKSMIKLHNKLITSNINVPNIIKTKEKESYVKILDDKYFVIYSFVEGNEIRWDSQNGKLDSDVIFSIASELRKIHKITNDNNEFKLPEVPFGDNNNRKSVLHFDLTKNNILVDSNNEITIIDFDDAKYGDSIYDVAILIANLFFSKTRGVDLIGMQKLIDFYYCDEIDLKKREIDLIKKYALQWIKYILDENEFDTSTTESFEVKYKLIKENL